MRAPRMESRYRMQPTDLFHGPAWLTIANVSYQGVERLRPVLHFAEHGKRLILNPRQCDELAALTGSAVPREWIGRRVVLEPYEDEGGPSIAILSSMPRRLFRPPRRRQIDPAVRAKQRRTTLALLLITVSLLAAVAYLEQSPAFWQWVADNQELFSPLLPLLGG